MSKNNPDKIPAWKKPPASMLVSCSTYSATLKIDATSSSETSVDFQRTTLPYNPEDRGLHNRRCENLKSCIVHSSTETSLMDTMHCNLNEDCSDFASLNKILNSFSNILDSESFWSYQRDISFISKFSGQINTKPHSTFASYPTV
jgi:hypothetical protein